MATEVTLHEAEIQAFFERNFGREMRTIVREGAALSRARCPRHRGDLARSIKGSVERYGAPDGGYRGYWGSDEEHALWVHDGTGIYGPLRRPIRPRAGQYLVFTPYRIIGVRTSATGVGGIRIPKRSRRTVRARQVRGQPATPFLTEPFKEVLVAHRLGGFISSVTGFTLPISPSRTRAGGLIA
jgi:hypothetical protein